MRLLILPLLACRCGASVERHDSAPAGEQVELLAQQLENTEVAQLVTSQDMAGALATLNALEHEDMDMASVAEMNMSFPVDTISNEANLMSWLANQQWREFTSPVGRPGSRETTDVKIQYVTIQGSGNKGALLFLPGASNSIAHHDENLYDLMQLGYSPIYAMVQRGQGESDRLLDNHLPIHVEQAEDYIADMRRFVDTAVGEIGSQKVFMMCFSLGCSIATAYMIEEYEHERPQLLQAVVMMSPAILVHLPGYDPVETAVVAKLSTSMGFGLAQPPGTPTTLEESWAGFCAFTAAFQSGSYRRCTRIEQLCYDSRSTQFGADAHTGLCNAGATFQSIDEGYDLSNFWALEFMSLGRKIAPPILMQLAGNVSGSDGAVDNPASLLFCANGASRCTPSLYPDALHSLLMSNDATRSALFNELNTFFQASTVLHDHNELPSNAKTLGESCTADEECATRRCEAMVCTQSQSMTFLGASGRNVPILPWVLLTACFAVLKCM